MDDVAAAPEPETQAQASHPELSAFVAAHAGAGKTTLLIDRLMRLMLAGADPGRILCLTYTKAAAAEMANRLQLKLSELVSLSDPLLTERLKKYAVRPEPETLARARALFARVLDLPGGMRIDTIHAFCQGLLRRFPLEAQVSPHFTVLEELETRATRDAVREASLPSADAAAVEVLAGLADATGFAGLFAALADRRQHLAAICASPPAARAAALRRAAGCRYSDEAAIWADALAWPGETALHESLARIQRDGSDAVSQRAARMLDWLALPETARRAAWPDWLDLLFTKDGTPRALKNLCNDALSAKCPELRAACAAEQARVAELLGEFAAHRTVAATAALLAVVAPMLAAYDAARGSSRLDFDDLIARTEQLLHDTGAAWVLYKLDGGLDHLLLDEVQDTAPAQWRIAEALTAEFFAGTGARAPVARTLFAVGDRKQSIFSFQGADPEKFDHWRTHYRARAHNAGHRWFETTLDRSHRSTAPVLQLVDAVFAAPDAGAGVCDGDILHHRVARAGQAGRVELWPLAPRPAPAETGPWSPPDRNRRCPSAQQTLVARIADRIAAELEAGIMLPNAGRKLHAGDILVLVRRRTTNLGMELVGALKARAVPVAGLDRMALTEQPAVQDLLSLCAALLLPEDELSLAEYLTSPLGGLADPSLMALAAGRTGTLAHALRTRAAEQPDWQAASDDFAALLARVDFVGPHALLSEILGPRRGRPRLLARLGLEAAEPIDELLEAALQYEATHPASLQGFLHWLERSGAEVKRQPEAAGEAVRIMTAHGAKGLEASLVILPDTVGLPRKDTAPLFAEDASSRMTVPLWAPTKAQGGPGVDRARQAAERRAIAEHNRLLYVALTRARDRLIVCGAEPKTLPPASWYARVRDGMRLAEARAEPDPWGELLVLDCPQTHPPAPAITVAPPPDAALPGWLSPAQGWCARPPPPEPARPLPLAPSRPDGAAHGPLPAARSPLTTPPGDRFARGRQVHALLQHLPTLPEATWPEAAARFAGPAIAAEVLAVLRTPSLAPLFGPGSRAEQPLTGTIGRHVITGRIDRLCVRPDQVLIADYKTGIAPPADAAAIPVAYLRQMAAYRALLRRIHPDRPVTCWLVFTDGPAVRNLPDALLDAHAPDAPA